MGDGERERPPWFELHEKALKEGAMCYLDPKLGYSVFTSAHHLERGFCCESGCRHCPFGYVNPYPSKLTKD